jgi:hypothetical protein
MTRFVDHEKAAKSGYYGPLYRVLLEVFPESTRECDDNWRMPLSQRPSSGPFVSNCDIPNSLQAQADFGDSLTGSPLESPSNCRYALRYRRRGRCVSFEDERDGFRRRLVARELSAERIITALHRRAADLPHRFAWSAGSGQSKLNRDRLTGYADLHKGQRCFILGNGPSLGKMDLSPLASEVTFGLNRIYLLFEKMGFEPSYYCAANELVLEQFGEEISSLTMPKFINWSGRAAFDPLDETNLFLRQALTLSDYFGVDLREPICSGGTVTYLALQAAYYMGFSQVVLLGVDHSFVDKGTPNRAEHRTSEVDENHFHPNYFPKGSRWQLPDLNRSQNAYRLARAAFEEDGRQVLDATVGGALDVFEKVDLDTLVEG